MGKVERILVLQEAETRDRPKVYTLAEAYELYRRLKAVEQSRGGSGGAAGDRRGEDRAGLS
jgi:hypothetical protein